MKPTDAVRTFPGLFYWARLPGFAAFCGVSGGICAAKLCLALAPQSVPEPSIYIKTLFLSTFFFATAGIFCKRPLARLVFFALCGAALFAEKELNLRDFYRKMEIIGENRQIFTLNVRITSPVAAAYSRYKFRCRVDGAEGADAERLLRGRTLQCVSRTPLPPYGAITVQGRYAVPRPAAGPFGYDEREYFAVNNIRGAFTVSRILSNPPQSPQTPAGSFTDKLSYRLRTGVHDVINKATTDDARAILHASFLDEKEHLSERLNVIFRKSGIIHLLAISGFHSALLYAAVSAILGLLTVPPRYRTIISIAALWGYLFFIGFIPSLFRSTMMVTFFCVSLVFQRKNHVMHTLGISGFFWLCISPHSLFSPGFQLSFAATAGIVLFPKILETLTQTVTSKINNKPAEFVAGRALASFWMSAASTAATAPALLWHFGTFSLYGIFFNMVAIPMMSVAMWAFFIALILSPVGFLANAAVWCAEKTLLAMVYLGSFCERVQWSEVVVPRATALQLFTMSVFMVGLCVIRPNLRGRYALRAGSAAALILAITALHSSMTVKNELFEFKTPRSTVNVVIYKDNNAWITADGGRNDVQRILAREAGGLLYRKKVKNVPLLVINEEAEEEAHEFAFNTKYSPRTIVLRRKFDGRGRPDDGYTTIDGRYIISPEEVCSLKIDYSGRVELKLKK